MRAILRAYPGQTVAVVAFQFWLLLAGISLADPCGMVPPIDVQDNTSLVRVGDQQTYVSTRTVSRRL